MIREFRDQRPFNGSPGLIAVFRALRRLLAPRHPPHALSSLAALTAGPPPCRHAAGPEALTVLPAPALDGRGSVTILSFSRAHAEIACETVSRPIHTGHVR